MVGLHLSSRQIMKLNKYYVDNTEALLLIQKLKNTPIEKRHHIEECIVKKLSYLVYSKIKKYKNCQFYDDLVQEGRIGLLSAVYNFDSNKCTNFFKFAILKIQTNIYKYFKLLEKVEEPIRFTYLDPHDYYEKQQCYTRLFNAINNLSKIEQDIINMRFFEAYTYQQIGDMFSLSRQRIEQLQNRALSRLYENLRGNIN